MDTNLSLELSANPLWNTYRHVVGEFSGVSYVPAVSEIQLQYNIEKMRIELSDEMWLTATLDFKVSPLPEPIWWVKPLSSPEALEEHKDPIAGWIQAASEDWLHWSPVSVIRIRRLREELERLRCCQRLLNLRIRQFLRAVHFRRRFSCQVARNEKSWRLLHGSHPPREDAMASLPASAENSGGFLACQVC